MYRTIEAKFASFPSSTPVIVKNDKLDNSSLFAANILKDLSAGLIINLSPFTDDCIFPVNSPLVAIIFPVISTFVAISFPPSVTANVAFVPETLSTSRIAEAKSPPA